MVVGYEVGNDYDIGARLLAKYLSKQLPGQPAMVVQNHAAGGGTGDGELSLQPRGRATAA